MPRISEVFKGNYFNATDFDKNGKDLTIAFVEMEKVGKNDEKLVVHFEDVEDDKVLPLNRTNALELAELIGDDSDDWGGSVVNFYRDMVMFNGKRTPAIRVRKSKGSSSSSRSSKAD